jgi:hypothetical protein
MQTMPLSGEIRRKASSNSMSVLPLEDCQFIAINARYFELGVGLTSGDGGVLITSCKIVPPSKASFFISVKIAQIHS